MEDPKQPFRVEWAPEKLDQIRIQVVDAFYAVPRGGVEIGGVLLGRFDGQTLSVEETVPLECEHLTGPSFVLSAKDEMVLAGQLRGLGDQVLGWFHSHTRSEVLFSPQDLAVQKKFFPKPWQVGMVLRPANMQPVRAAYFFGGAGAGADVFTIEPLRGERKAAQPKGTIAPSPPMAPEPVVAPKPVAPLTTPLAAPLTRPPAAPLTTPLAAPIAPTAVLGAATAHPARPVQTVRQSIREPESFEAMIPSPKKRSYLLPSILLAMAALGGAAFLMRDEWLPKPPEPLNLRASDVDGKLMIRWTPVRDITTGELHILENGKSTDVALDAAQLGSGLYVFVRKATSETVKMKVGAREDVTSFGGPLAQ